jgi:hypothetical protein
MHTLDRFPMLTMHSNAHAHNCSEFTAPCLPQVPQSYDPTIDPTIDPKTAPKADPKTDRSEIVARLTAQIDELVKIRNLVKSGAI